MILNGIILNDNNRNLKIINSVCVKKGEKQPNGKFAKSQIWWYEIECLTCGHRYFSSRGKVISAKRKCPLCSSRVVVKGVNDVNTTRPDIIMYLKNKVDGELYSKGSSKKVLCKCPKCGYEKYMSISNLTYHGFYCDICSDSISYPNKCFINILKQMNIDFIPEYSPYWIGKKRYDFYLKDYELIIEVDGGQHFDGNFMISLEEQNNIDRWKDFMALKNGKKLIRINCSISNIEFIKNNILKSELNTILDFSIVNWDKVEKFAMSSLLVEACKLKKENSSYTTKDIGNMLSVSQSTISRWLKIGNKLNLCEYIPEVESSKNGRKVNYDFNKPVEVYDINYNFLFDEPSIKVMSENSKNKLGKYISRESISKCCHEYIPSCKGFIFKFKNIIK